MSDKRGINDSTIARIAGNIISADVEDWLPGGGKRAHAVQAAVATARAIAEEVERTRPAAELKDAAVTR